MLSSEGIRRRFDTQSYDSLAGFVQSIAIRPTPTTLLSRNTPDSTPARGHRPSRHPHVSVSSVERYTSNKKDKLREKNQSTQGDLNEAAAAADAYACS
jgi:hypothetical protein